MEQRFSVRVYYEDTDCMGVVYHANYLRFLERARTEYLAEIGPSIVEWAERNVMFPIYSINITFRSPARLGDRLVVISDAKQASPYRLTFQQRIEREQDGKVVVEASVDVVCTDLKANLRDFPKLSDKQGA
jgi:tol-pal system-associated acyl-CoA thioesterase